MKKILSKLKNKNKLLLSLFFVSILIVTIFVGLFLNLKTKPSTFFSTSTQNQQSNSASKNDENTKNKKIIRNNNVILNLEDSNFKSFGDSQIIVDRTKKYFNVDNEKTKVFEIMYQILKNNRINDYDLSKLFGWFNTIKNIELSNSFKFNLELNKEKPNGIIKWLVPSLLILIQTFIFQSKQIKNIKKYITFSLEDIEKLKTNPKQYIISPLNNLFEKITLVYKTHREDNSIPKTIDACFIPKFCKGLIHIPTIGFKFDGSIKYNEILSFIYRIIKYLIFQITKVPILNKIITFRNVVSLFENYYKNNEINRKKFYEFFLNSLIENFSINFEFNDHEAEYKKFKDVALDIIFALHGKDPTDFLDSILILIINVYMGDSWGSKIYKNLKTNGLIEKIDEYFFPSFKKTIFMTELIRILGFKQDFSNSKLIKKYGDSNTNIISWVKTIYKELIKGSKKWIESELIDEEKLNFMKNLINELNVEEFWKKFSNEREFKWNTLETFNAKIKPYVANFKAEKKELLIIKYKENETNQNYTIILKRNGKDSYELIYFATNHYKHLVETFINGFQN